MKYNEVYMNLFTVDNEYLLAHCISSDAAMGKGIAVDFCRRFNLYELQRLAQHSPLKVGSCAKVGRVLNLVTKKKYSDKPTYNSFTLAVHNMKNIAIKHNIKKIAMPKIGAGLDRLNWTKNRSIIKDVFSDTDIEILVCKLK
ncbi:macro domain-containing protein (plasmid) [Rossellomorea sp. AcN35-11]|nr:macro domain-containing protein [Rossellomorea aquimaris]WJV31701.1 macro domain-containing protein [Rossellomorea sp. AcN35-11]